MLEVKVKKQNEKLLIRWLFTKVEIPIADIQEVFLDETFGGAETDAIRIGFPYGTYDRLIINTKKDSYILFLNNAEAVKARISTSC